MKKLTIIIPVYNAEKYIERCLKSIMLQINFDYEVILINDGSRDNSYEIIKKYEIIYPGIVRVINQGNSGVANTRNRGIKEAQGEYICFIDNDDYIDNDYFEQFLDAVGDYKYDIVMGGYRRVSEKKVKFEVKPVKGKWYPFIVVAPWAKIYRRAFLMENNIEFLNYGLGEDVFFSLTAYSYTENIKIIDYVGYNWFFNEGSVSNTSQKGFQKSLDALYLLETIYKRNGKRNKYYEYYYVRYLVWYLLFSGREASSRDFMVEYRRTFSWLRKKRIPLYFPLFSKDISGEKWNTRVIVNAFLLLDKIKIVPLFSKIYCRG